MERIKTFVQKIQEIYYGKHPKSAIDIDLMMDYTRVMYMDMLEWRKEFTEPIHSDMAAMMKENPIKTQEEATAAQILAEASVENADDVQIDETTDEHASEAIDNIVPAETSEEQKTLSIAEIEEGNNLSQEEEKEEKPELEQHDFPEEEQISTLMQEHTGISFEAPSPAEKSIEIEDTLVEETPLEIINTIVEIPAPPPIAIPLSKTNPYEPAKLFDSISEAKDIRSSIGINDKYLFLNELFNNHKSDYEETLDRLNQTTSISEAKNWMKTKVAAASHWDDNDATVQSFYTLLEKHFSVR